MQPRDWQLLSEAIEFYNNRCGYEFVSLPWYVHGVSVEATAHYSWISNISGQYSKSLVGSAEQAFIDWDAQDALGKGRFVACTPGVADEAAAALLRRASVCTTREGLPSTRDAS